MVPPQPTIPPQPFTPSVFSPVVNQSKASTNPSPLNKKKRNLDSLKPALIKKPNENKNKQHDHKRKKTDHNKSKASNQFKPTPLPPVISATTVAKETLKPQVFEVKRLFIVPDTNAWVDHTYKVLNLRNYENITIANPLTVIKELDGLKKNTDEKVRINSAISRNIIAEGLAKNADPSLSKKWMIGQNPLDKNEEILIDNNDDKILNYACCLSKYVCTPEDAVILLTNDRGLQAKAILSKVTALNMEDLIKSLPSALSHNGSSLALTFLNGGHLFRNSTL